MQILKLYTILALILLLWCSSIASQSSMDYAIKFENKIQTPRGEEMYYKHFSTPNTHSRKKEIKMATGLMIFSVVSTGASLPFFLYYGVSSQPWGGSSFWGSSHTRDVNKTPLYIGGGLFLIGALAGAKSMVLFFKDPVSDKKTTRNKITDNVSIQMTIHPDKAAIYVQF